MKVVKFLSKILLFVLIVMASFILVLTLSFYNPKPIEPAKIYANDRDELINLDQSYSVTSFNIGYAGLDSSMDFFMDGGSKVRPDSRDQVEENLDGIGGLLKELDSDFYLLQEVDEKSSRTYKINQVEYLNSDYNKSFTYNYKVLYVPYPLPTMGSIQSGLMTMSKAKIEEAQRYDLYNPFSWPTKIANLNRGLLVNSYKIAGSDKMLHMVNLHMDAYDEGDGRKIQTKQLVDFMEEKYQKGDYVIAGGDFNQLLPGIEDRFKNENKDFWEPKKLALDDVGEDFSFGVDKENPTCRSLHQAYDGSEEFLQYYIDGFLLSPNVSMEEVGVIKEDYRYSDHNPIRMTFKLD